MSDEVIEHLFSVQQPASFSLSNIRGSVVIVSGDPDVIHVTAVRRAGSGDPDHTQVEITQAQDGSVRAETRYDALASGLLKQRQPCKVDYTVQVPAQCTLRVSGVSNSAAVSQVEGEAEIKTVSGDLRLSGLTGSLQVTSVSGKVEGEGLRGSLHLDTVSGDVRLVECTLADMVVSSVSARVEIHSPLQGSEQRFKSVSGDVRLVVPGPLGCRVVSESLSGRLYTNLPARLNERQLGRSVLEVGSGEVQIRHNSISGSFYLESASGAGQALPQSVAEKEPAEQPGEVLERLSRGEISVDQAVDLLGK